MDCRGAENAAEFERQWPKTVAAIVGTGADMVGVLEIENDGYGAGSALQFLVDKLNAATAPGTYAFIDADAGTGQVNASGPTPSRSASSTSRHASCPVGQTAALEHGGVRQRRRRGAAQSPVPGAGVRAVGTGARFVVSVNHLKSKGSACDAARCRRWPGELQRGPRTIAANELTRGWPAIRPAPATRTSSSSAT